LKPLLDGLSPAEFSKPYRHLHTIVWFYVDSYIPGQKLTLDKARSSIFFKLLNERREKAIQELRETTIKEANISISQ
jgi:hypothetical protein